MGPTVHGLSLAVVPQLSPYHLNDAVHVRLYFTNRNRQAAVFRAWWDVRFDVVGPGLAVVPAHPLRIRHDYMYTGVMANGKVQIPMGSGYAWTDDLTNTNDLVKPGTYTLRAVVHAHGPEATITSPWVSIAVLR